MGVQRCRMIPNVVIQRVTADGRTSRAVKMPKDRAFLVTERNVPRPRLVMELPRRRLEGIGSDGKGRVLAQIVLTHLGAEPRQQNAELDGLVT